MGNVQDCLDSLKDAGYFSTTDLAQGYMQVPLAPELPLAMDQNASRFL